MKVCEICRARFRGNPTACPLDGGRLLDLPDPLLGRLVAGRYVVQQKIGAGGMGTVYRATHEVLGVTVAIKFLSADLAIDPTSRQRFLREAKAASRIQHEHIIEVTDFGETDDGLAYLVMEYLEGRGLTDAIEAQSTGMQPRRALGIALQVAQALARAHELDVTHRDIKPDNIFLVDGYDGDFIKILDFGLAHMKGELRLTATGTVFGTPEYMAPEQARGMKSTLAVDLYALGCVLFEMLTGRLPFEGRTPDLILKHMREPPPRPSSLVKTVPPQVDDLVLRLLAKDPAARPKNAYALSDEIRKILEALGSMRTPTRTSEPRPAVPTALSQTIVTEDAWEARVAVFRRLVARAHPHGPPPWLLPTIDDLAARIRDMRALRKNLDDLASQATRRETDMREIRTRIGRALDELAQDEARTQRALAETRERWREAKARLDEIERPVLRAWAEIPPMPAGGPAVDRETAEALRDAGQLAAIWIEADRSVGSLQRDMLEREREIEDLRFQVAQLKGRLGTINAEGDLDTSGNRDERTRLDADLRKLVDDIVRTAEPVYRHFMAFPELRSEVLNSGEAARAG